MCAMDWVLKRTTRSTALAARHLANGTLLLYDVSSRRRKAAPAAGRDRPPRRGQGTTQIVYGLLRSAVPIAIEVFDEQHPRPEALDGQIASSEPGQAVRSMSGGRSGMSAMRASATNCVCPVDRIAPAAPQIKHLVEDRALRLSLFDEQNLIEIVPDFPGRRPGAVDPGRGRRRHTPSCCAPPTRTGEIAAATAATVPLRGGTRSACEWSGTGDYHMAKHFTIRSPTRHSRHRQHQNHRRRGRPRRHRRSAQPARRHPRARRCRAALRTSPTSSGSPHPRHRARLRPIRHRLADWVRADMSCACCPTTSLAHGQTSRQSCSTTRPTRRQRETRRPRRRPQRSNTALAEPSPKRTKDDYRCTASPACSPT